MNGAGAVISAVAAVMAATLAGINLYVTGRRDISKWRREALVDAFVELLNASFAGKDACKRFCNEYRKTNSGNPRTQSSLADSEDALRAMRKHLTKLRLMAPSRVLEACAELYHRNSDFHNLLLSNGEPIRDLEDLRIRDEIRQARNAVVSVAKGVMHIE